MELLIYINRKMICQERSLWGEHFHRSRADTTREGRYK